ncbi:MAG TPA: hypothetical protein PLX18_11880 [Anaerohalosphaeraceae bacterium]|jgi:hypothetical protein|nr:hypothetical protein [Anaerohalosphaeraceae bacterium]HQI08541.1 hypothetical protein [Anaerohalosphaeraceae bacterium]HQJ68874.1 hypothetical protein [Anaerohalosphaeraceae bacterium]
MAVKRRNRPPSPGNGVQEDEGAEVLEMVPVELRLKRIEKRFQIFLGKRTILNITAVSYVKERVPTLLSKRVPFFIEKSPSSSKIPSSKVSQLEYLLKGP